MKSKIITIQELNATSKIIPPEELSRLVRTYQKSLFRLQTLPAYGAKSDDEAFAEYLEGKLEPKDKFESWRKFIFESTSSGKDFINLHIIYEGLTPYLRFVIDWGYIGNSLSGQKNKLIYNPIDSQFKDLFRKDFWLVDEKTAVYMVYDENYRFQESRLIIEGGVLAELIKIRDLCLSGAMNFSEFLKLYRRGEIR